MCSSQASGNKLWDHFSFMAPLLMERNSTQTTFQHLPAVVQEFVTMDFFLAQKVFMEDAMVEVMVFEGRGKRFVDQLTRIFERQLFFRNLYQSFQLRNKTAAHLQNMRYYFVQKPTLL